MSRGFSEIYGADKRESEERETREMAQFQQDVTYLSVILVYMFSISTKTKGASPVSESWVFIAEPNL